MRQSLPSPGRRTRTAAWVAVGVLGTAVLLAAALAVAGYVAGGPTDYDEPPAVDHAEPGGEVAADALAQLAYRDHTTERWVSVRNRSTDRAKRGVVRRVTVEHSERRVRMTSWGTATLGAEPGETVTTNRTPGFELFGNRLYYRWQRRPGDGTWERVFTSGRNYDRHRFLPVESVEPLRGASWTIVAENDSALVVRTGDSRATAAFATLFRYREDATATVVVAKGPNPHVTRVSLRNRSGPRVQTETFAVREVGSATAPRPEPAPPVSVTETVARVVVGLERLFG